jgi:phosphoglycerate dehydrogenase-like enzyme
VAVYLGRPDALEQVYGPRERAAAARLVRVAAPEALAEAEVALATWGTPVLDAAFLAGAPRLRAVLYGAGSVRAFVTDALWDRGVRVSSAAEANAACVAEYTLAVILFSLKHGWRLAAAMRGDGGVPDRHAVPGACGSVVGLVSLGAVGRLVRRRLRPFDLRVLAFDPFVGPEEARRLGVERCGLDELFRRSDVVSLHAPLLDTTRGLITGEHVAAMRPGATLVNTARGAIVREPELIAVLRSRPDLQAVLDVTDPEPPSSGSPLRTLPNVVLTPHIAGCVGPERRRLGRAMVGELRRLLAGRPLRWEVTRERAALLGVP